MKQNICAHRVERDQWVIYGIPQEKWRNTSQKVDVRFQELIVPEVWCQTSLEVPFYLWNATYIPAVSMLRIYSITNNFLSSHTSPTRMYFSKLLYHNAMQSIEYKNTSTAWESTLFQRCFWDDLLRFKNFLSKMNSTIDVFLLQDSQIPVMDLESTRPW